MNNNEDLERFMQFAGTNEKDNDPYYRGVYEKISSGRLIVWNWAAFLFGGNWIIFRKMYWYAHLFYAAIIGINFFLFSVVLPNIFGEVFWMELVRNNRFVFVIVGQIWAHILCGMFGNLIYVFKISRMMRKHSVKNICTQSIDCLSSFISISSMFCLLFVARCGVPVIQEWGMIVYYTALYVSIFGHFASDTIKLRGR
jgi:hypothetical protein